MMCRCHSFFISSALVLLSFIGKSHGHTTFDLHLRDESTSSPDLPPNWNFLGCFTDNPSSRTLTGASFTDTTNMTVESCVGFCNGQTFIFAGLEFAEECFCGNFLGGGSNNASLTDCDLPCTGDSDELCGGPDRLSIYWNGLSPIVPPMTVQSVGLWESLGCYSDSPASRTFPFELEVSNNMTVEVCTDGCFDAGFPLAGVEFGEECFCGDAFGNGGVPIDPSNCNVQCAGNSSEFCGGPNALNVYNFTGSFCG